MFLLVSRCFFNHRLYEQKEELHKEIGVLILNFFLLVNSVLRNKSEPTTPVKRSVVDLFRWQISHIHFIEYFVKSFFRQFFVVKYNERFFLKWGICARSWKRRPTARNSLFHKLYLNISINCFVCKSKMRIKQSLPLFSQYWGR